MTTPAERRYTAIRATVEACIDTSNGNVSRDGMTREKAAQLVNAMRTLGRSPQWSAALDTWCDWLQGEEYRFDWAVLQGSITAVHASGL